MSQSQSNQTPTNEGDTPDNKVNEGPDRVAKDIDESKQWDDVADDKGYQKGDQGGYKGSYDETKFDQIQDDDIVHREPQGDDTLKKGDDDGQKRPMKQNEQTSDKRKP